MSTSASGAIFKVLAVPKAEVSNKLDQPTKSLGRHLCNEIMHERTRFDNADQYEEHDM